MGDSSNQNPLEHRVSRLEAQVDETVKKVTEMDKTVALFSASQQQFSSALEVFSKSNDKVVEAINHMKMELLGAKNSIECNSEDINGLNEAIKNIEKKAEEGNEKSKVDFIKLAKDNIIPLLFVIFLLLNQLNILTIK